MTAVLDIRAARPKEEESPLGSGLDLRLDPGELAVVRAEDAGLARALALLCAGLVPLDGGAVRFQGQDWSQLGRRAAEALRARIGLAPGDGGWLPHLTVEEGILLPRLHHDPTPEADLCREADALCRLFGLDGLPSARPAEMSRGDLARAACARAFLGQPALVILESPLDREMADALADPVLAALAPARGRGAAAIWSTRSRRAWEEPGFPATQWFTLEEGALRAEPP
ncbi:ATP-binding cassette domain-containing protein [Falsiroseomonas sp. CW058]|uniref:ATP-binding cassette domain-containing protein n=1 Tax=Falsiroseomonas sp. CW058 TaxID=3388664 RepID=UPI003D31DC89